MQDKMSYIRRFSGILFLLFSCQLQAAYDVSDLKKLFTDKSQRAQIDAARFGEASGAEVRQTRKVKVSGYMTRSDGKSVVWVNNKNTIDNSKLGNVKINQSSVGKNKKVTLIINKKTVRLRPGETWSGAPDFYDNKQ